MFKLFKSNFFRLFGHNLSPLYPNPLGSHGKTIQSQVNCDTPDLGQLDGWLVVSLGGKLVWLELG